jgi:hypothetical protein
VNSIFGPISHHIIFLFSFYRLDVHGVPNSWLLTLTGRDDDHMRVCTGFERPTRCRKARKLRKLFSWLGHTTGYRSFHCSEHVVVEPGRYFLASDLQFLGLGVEPTILDVVGFVLSRKKSLPRDETTVGDLPSQCLALMQLVIFALTHTPRLDMTRTEVHP